MCVIATNENDTHSCASPLYADRPIQFFIRICLTSVCCWRARPISNNVQQQSNRFTIHSTADFLHDFHCEMREWEKNVSKDSFVASLFDWAIDEQMMIRIIKCVRMLSQCFRRFVRVSLCWRLLNHSNFNPEMQSSKAIDKQRWQAKDIRRCRLSLCTRARARSNWNRFSLVLVGSFRKFYFIVCGWRQCAHTQTQTKPQFDQRANHDAINAQFDGQKN